MENRQVSSVGVGETEAGLALGVGLWQPYRLGVQPAKARLGRPWPRLPRVQRVCAVHILLSCGWLDYPGPWRLYTECRQLCEPHSIPTPKLSADLSGQAIFSIFVQGIHYSLEMVQFL